MEIIFGIFSFTLGILSVLLAIMTFFFSRDLSKRTEALIQSEDKRVKELLAKMDERTAKMDERALEHSKILERMDERALEHSKILERMEERALERALEHSKILERIEETHKYVAELVRIEGEKTRSLISH